jgi:hypothetical protein
MNAILAAFNLPPGEMPPSIKRADNLLLLAEKAQVMGSLVWDHTDVAKWGIDANEMNAYPPIPIHAWRPDFAKQKFLDRFWELVARRRRNELELPHHGKHLRVPH